MAFGNIPYPLTIKVLLQENFTITFASLHLKWQCDLRAGVLLGIKDTAGPGLVPTIELGFRSHNRTF